MCVYVHEIMLNWGSISYLSLKCDNNVKTGPKVYPGHLYNNSINY